MSVNIVFYATIVDTIVIVIIIYNTAKIEKEIRIT